MLDLKFIRENPDAVRKAIQQKRVNLNLDELLAADQKVLELKKQVQALQEEKNANAKKVPKATAEERPALIAHGRAVGEQLVSLEPKITEAEAVLQNYLWLVPNIPADNVPVGPDESGNVERRKWGTPPQFSFKALDHVQLLDKHGWAELERVAKVSGSRTYALTGDLVLLEMAVIRFAMEKLKSKGFKLLTVPAVVREHALYGTGHFPTGREQVYHLKEDDIYLSGTAEVPVNSLHSGETLTEAQLPILYGAFSPCFRREAGSAGRDVRGLMRVHQFNKVEQFVLCKNDPAESAKWHHTLLTTSEEIVQELEIPYRVIEVCTGDMGAGKYKMHDIECWVPSEGKYRETHSCSSLHDWQARRANLRYRDSTEKMRFVYTLNNTAAATPRLLIPLLENHQQADGSIKIPKALQPFMGGAEFLGKS